MKWGLAAFLLLSAEVIGSPLLYQAEISQGIEFYFQENFSQAEQTFLNLIQADTLEPVGYYFLALTFQAQMLDLESDFKMDQFEAALESSIQLAENRLKSNKSDKMAFLTLGNCYGSWAIQEARAGSWFRAFRLGLRAKDKWEKAIALDSGLYEAYAGLGSYLYWKSVFTKRFNWLPFVKDKRQQGIQMLRLASENSEISRDFALSSLMWVNLKEKSYKEALDLAFHFQNKYPQAKFPLWAEGFIYYEKFDWRNALQAFKKLFSRLQETQPFNHYNLIEVEFRMANCYYNLGKYNEARFLCEKILDYDLDKRTQQRQRQKIIETKKLLEKISKIEK